MWDGVSGGRGNREGEERNEEERKTETEEEQNARIAASALAAFANPDAAANAAANARLRAYEQASYDYPFVQAGRSLLYPSQAAVEALRRQEEIKMRQQALFNLQQQQAFQRQELQELEYARQLQEQRVADIVARTRNFDAFSASGENRSILETFGGAPSANEARLKTDDERKEEDAKPQPKLEESGKYPAIAARGKPEAMAAAFAAARVGQDSEEEEAVAGAAPLGPDTKQTEAPVSGSQATPTKKKTRKRKASTSPSRPKKKAATGPGTPTVNDPVPPITDVDYENVEALMENFCKVPLLAEFSRPVALLHPELVPRYSKIVSHPIDLGHVCRMIRRRQYKDTRAIQLDMWRIFANCIKYHTSPANKDNSVPSFVSIALHLRDYFNALWQEHMVPSDPPVGISSQKSKGSKNIFSTREADRKNRIATTNATLLSGPCLQKTAAAIHRFIELDGRVDKLDVEPLFDQDNMDEDDDMDEFVANLRTLRKKLLAFIENDEDISVEQLDAEFRRCYTGSELFESKPSLRIRIGHRVDRLKGKIIANIFEANSRGVNQSSVWGCMAAAIWARESSKKPYWPALVLGIMAPEDQKEDWHVLLTERNERRLPEKLRTDLNAGKRKAELAIKRQNAGQAEQNSYFLVEFMGTHEFIWVKESDMIETFDPNVNPNQSVVVGNATKKKRSSRSHDILGSETFANALNEGRWALEEFEMQLNDPCGDLVEEEDDDEQETNYSYAILCQSDEEADEEDAAHDSVIGHEMTFSEAEEANELLAGDGLLDFSVEGRKNAKKRTTAMKKEKAEADKTTKKEKGGRTKRTKASRSDRDKEEKREQRELEQRRKKRTRERERVLKQGSSSKKRRLSADDDQTQPAPRSKRDPLSDKSGRANAIVKAYLMRVAEKEDLKPLGLSGVMTMPVGQVDSTGLLGMALAFRAAAGELDMPESGDPESRGKPWENIDVDGPVSTKVREENLLKKKALLEEEIKRLKAATLKRKELREAALVEKRLMEEEVDANDKEVRLMLGKKSRKKPAKKAPKVEGAFADNDRETDGALSQEDSKPPSGATSPEVQSGIIVNEGDANDDDEVAQATVEVVNDAGSYEAEDAKKVGAAST